MGGEKFPGNHDGDNVRPLVPKLGSPNNPLPIDSHSDLANKPNSIVTDVDKKAKAARRKNLRRGVVAGLAGTAITAAAVAGVSHEQVRREKTAETKPEIKPLDIEGLRKGNRILYLPGEFRIDFSKVRARTSPHVEEDSVSGSSNRVDMGEEAITQSNIMVVTNEYGGAAYDKFGPWYVLFGSNGEAIYVTASDNSSGVSRTGSGQLLQYDNKQIERAAQGGVVEDALTSGVVIKNENGQSSVTPPYRIEKGQ
ncbi:hypothetical protein HYX70_04825 [Candidatus Saccharibacteria bacterium]|nr:hypothetical protein [Candidatus Saccharibacteria bacterium]